MKNILKTFTILAILATLILKIAYADTTLNYVVEARKYNANFNYKQAEKFYSKAFKQNNTNLSLMQEYLLFLVHQNNLKKSKKLANAILQQNPNHFLSNMVVLVDLINQNNLPQAVNNLSKLNQVQGSLADFVFKITNATNNYLNGNNADFVSIAKTLQHNNFNLTGEFADFYEYHTALLDLIQKNNTPALNKLNQVTSSAVSIQSMLLYLQLIYPQQKQRAITIFNDYLGDSFASNNIVNQYLKNTPDINLQMFFSSVFLKLSSLVDNEVNLNFLTSEHSTLVALALMLNKNNYMAKIALASHYYSVGDHNYSANILTSIPLNSYYAKIASYDIIEMLKYNNNKTLLLKYLNNWSAVDRDNPLIYIEKGQYYNKNAKYKKAIKQYTIALNLAKSNNSKLGEWLAYYFRGIAKDKNGNWNSAEQDFLNAIAIDNTDPLLVNYLAYSWLKRDKNIAKATEMLQNLVNQQTNNYNILDSYAFALLKNKQYNKALEYSKKAYAISPYDAGVVNNLADIYWLLNNKKEATYYWSLALNLTKDNSAKAEINNKLNNIMPTYLQ